MGQSVSRAEGTLSVIEALEAELDQAYRERAGTLIKGRDGWGWCVACGRTPVNCAEGYDTYPECCP
jgi:hypothetical protein